MNIMSGNKQTWEDIICPPLKGRSCKPRHQGITMVIDKGMGLNETIDLLELNAQFIDFIKLSFGTAALYQADLLQRKLQMAKNFQVAVYPGGTFLEIAIWQNKVDQLIAKLKELKIEWLEISDGTIEMSTKTRLGLISKAISNGFKVITEVGKKDPLTQPDDQDLIQTAIRDLEAGAQWVIIEARESGKGIGVYDKDGQIIAEKFNHITKDLPNQKIIWEAPLKCQQVALINHFGPEVNLGNIATGEVMAVEALRNGYRSDTWKKCISESLMKF